MKTSTSDLSIPNSDLELVLVEQPGVLATLSRWRPSVQIRSGTLDNTARCANVAERPSSNLGGCGFDSLPCY